MLQLGYYMQLSGSRKVIITPAKHCREVCSPLHTMMNEGDVCMYSNELFDPFPPFFDLIFTSILPFTIILKPFTQLGRLVNFNY